MLSDEGASRVVQRKGAPQAQLALKRDPTPVHCTRQSQQARGEPQAGEVNLRCQPATTRSSSLALAAALLKDVAIVWKIR